MADLAEVAAKVAAEVEEKPAKAAPVPAKVEEADEQETQQQAAPSPAEAARQKAETSAREKGWRPKEEWEGDPEDWVSAKVFLKRGEEIEERQSWKKQLKSLEAQNKELVAIFKSQQSAQTQAKVQDVMARRDAAIEAGDKNQVRAIEAELSQIAPPEPTPAEITEWVGRHSEWWGVDPMATQAAVVYYGNLEAKNRADVGGNLEKTEKWLKRRFPDLFPEDQAKAAEAAQAHVQQTRKLSQVAISSPSPPPSKKGWSDLPAEAKRIGEELVRKKVMTREEYAESYLSRHA